MSKPLDKTMQKVEAQMIKDAAAKDEMQPLLDSAVQKVQAIDNKITWFKNKITEMETQKKAELKNVEDKLELACTTYHTLKNGYFVKPDNRYKIEIEDTAKFLGWLKKNKTTLEVLEFFEGAFLKTNLKRFCEEEFNEQKLKGIFEPSIDGIKFGDETYRRYKTGIKKEKKK